MNVGLGVTLPEFNDQFMVVVFSVASPFQFQLTDPRGTGIGFVTPDGFHNKNI